MCLAAFVLAAADVGQMRPLLSRSLTKFLSSSAPIKRVSSTTNETNSTAHNASTFTVSANDWLQVRQIWLDWDTRLVQLQRRKEEDEAEVATLRGELAQLREAAHQTAAQQLWALGSSMLIGGVEPSQPGGTNEIVMIIFAFVSMLFVAGLCVYVLVAISKEKTQRVQQQDPPAALAAAAAAALLQLEELSPRQGGVRHVHERVPAPGTFLPGTHADLLPPLPWLDST